MSNIFGRILQIATWGESHGPSVGVVIDGLPAGLALSREDVMADLRRRRPGYSALASARREPDEVEFLSGLFEGRTLGTPLAMLVRNCGQHSQDYASLAQVYRPSHADFTWQQKYGCRDPRGGGRASARETVARVAAGAVARQFWASLGGGEILAWTQSIHDITSATSPVDVTRNMISASEVGCPDLQASALMCERVASLRSQGDSCGGVVQCLVRGVPLGLGEPVFGKLEARLAEALMSIPAVRGFEVGDGFAAATLLGSQCNDPFVVRDGRVTTATNRSGGIQGGISNGQDIVLRVAFRPTPSIAREQQTVNTEGQEVRLSIPGRHDPCIVPRALVVVEAMVALVLADCCLLARLSSWK